MDLGCRPGGDPARAAGRDLHLGCGPGSWLVPLMLASLAACSGDPLPSPTSTTTALPAPSAQTPPTPSPEPTPVSVWLAPSVPEALRDLTQETLEAAPEHFYAVPVSDQAQVRVESRPELPLTHWVYAAVAPFPTLEDSFSMEQLRGLWEGGEQQPAVLLSPATAEALRPQLGEPAGAALGSTAESELLDGAWALKEARARG